MGCCNRVFPDNNCDAPSSIVYIISMSISDADAVLAQEVWLLPKGFSLGSYNLVFENRNMGFLWKYHIRWWEPPLMCSDLNGSLCPSRKEFLL